MYFPSHGLVLLAAGLLTRENSASSFESRQLALPPTGIWTHFSVLHIKSFPLVLWESGRGRVPTHHHSEACLLHLEQQIYRREMLHFGCEIFWDVLIQGHLRVPGIWLAGLSVKCVFTLDARP